MNSPICVTNREHTASFRIASLLTIAPLWLILAAANASAHAQTVDAVSNSSMSATTSTSPADWTQFHRDNMQRWNPYETALGVDNVGSLQVKWKNPIGTYSDNVLDARGFWSSPAVVNGVIYFGSSEGNVYALNAGTGATLWSFDGASPIGQAYVESSPAVVNGVVYVGSIVVGPFDGGDLSGGNVSALNASTGGLLWTGGGPVGHSSPAVVNGVVYAGSWDGNVYALNASTGALLWSFPTPDFVDSSPAVGNGVVYITSHTSLYALNASTGAKLWSYATGGYVESSPAVANGVVYFGSDDHNVYALNASTGAKLWSYATGSLVESSPAVANGVVYITSNDTNVYALNASTGDKLWSYATGDSLGDLLESSPAVANGVVYFSANGNVFGLNASTGAKLWSYDIEGFEYSSPTVVNGVVYIRAADFGAGQGNTYAFSVGADLFLRIQPTPTTVHQGDLITYAFPVWNLGPANAVHEVLNTQVPAETTLDYIRISGTPGLGTCTGPPYQGTGKIVCHENSAMAPNTTWTVRVVVKVTAPSGTVITENAATLADTSDPHLANNTATVSTTVQ